MVSTASFPPLQKTQERGTHSFGMGNEVTRKRRATRPMQQYNDVNNLLNQENGSNGLTVIP